MVNKDINIFRIIWVTGLFSILVIILLMVINYKINYQYLTIKNLYFYDCNNSICTARVKDGIGSDKLYSIYECEYDICPDIIRIVNDSYVLLTKNGINILYDVINAKVISDSYDDYKFLSEKYIIVKKNNYEGLIDLENNILIPLEYEQIGYMQGDVLIGYNISDIIVKKADLYGIVSIKTGEVKEKFEYSEEQIEELLKKINT